MKLSFPRGILLGVLQLGILLGLGGKYLRDRATLPRVWARAVPYDPDLPIRGRYVRLQIQVEGSRELLDQPGMSFREVDLVALGSDRLAAIPDRNHDRVEVRSGGDSTAMVLSEPVAFFIPEKVPDPSRRAAGEELWVEVTIPKRGPPRPIRLGVKKEGNLTPLDLR